MCFGWALAKRMEKVKLRKRYCGLVVPHSITELFTNLFFTCPLPGHDTSQCWVMNNWALMIKLTIQLFHENTFENVIWKYHSMCLSIYNAKYCFSKWQQMNTSLTQCVQSHWYQCEPWYEPCLVNDCCHAYYHTFAAIIIPHACNMSYYTSLTSLHS